MSKVKKLLLPLLSLSVLSLVIYYVTPPKSIYEAAPFQIVAVFGPLFLFIYSTVQLITKLWKKSLVISSGILLLVIIYLLDFLYLSPLIIIGMIFLFRRFKKPDPYQLPRKIPKLSRLEKQR